MLARYIEEGNVKKAIKILKRSKKEGILSLTDETFKMFPKKHQKACKVPIEILLDEEIQDAHQVIRQNRFREAIKKTRSSTRPSRLDGDGWRRILVSKSFGTFGEDLRKQ